MIVTPQSVIKTLNEEIAYHKDYCEVKTEAIKNNLKRIEKLKKEIKGCEKILAELLTFRNKLRPELK